MDTETTAEVLGISGGTVASHLHRALASLRSQLSEPSHQLDSMSHELSGAGL
jgi:DNA-directed RNA polymerase specialized sigma24 family protein